MSDGVHRVELKNALDQHGKRADHWADLRPMTGRDMMALASVDGDLAGVIARLGAAVVAHDFTTEDETQPADILDQPWGTLRKLLTGWRSGSEDDALPKA